MRIRALAAAGLVMAGLVGCSGGSSSDAPEESPAAQLAAARANLEKSPAVAFTLTSTGLPSKAVGVSGAKGTGLFKPPSFQGTLNATVSGVTGTVDVSAVEHKIKVGINRGLTTQVIIKVIILTIIIIFYL
jgi:lipoprotein LprG